MLAGCCNAQAVRTDLAVTAGEVATAFVLAVPVGT